MFPAIDVLRLSVRHAAVCEHYCNPSDGPKFLSLLLNWLSKESVPVPVRLLSLRTLANLFRNNAGLALIHAQHPRLLQVLSGVNAAGNKNVEIALATVLLNVAVLLFSKPGCNEPKALLISCISAVCDGLTDNEAGFRIVVALGTLITGDTNAKEMVKSSGTVKYVSGLRKVNEPKKVGEAARNLTTLVLT